MNWQYYYYIYKEAHTIQNHSKEIYRTVTEVFTICKSQVIRTSDQDNNLKLKFDRTESRTITKVSTAF